MQLNTIHIKQKKMVQVNLLMNLITLLMDMIYYKTCTLF